MPERKRKLESVAVSPPEHILVVDNGGDTVKFGWSTDAAPQKIPNVTARLQQQWSVLAGDQIQSIQNKNQLIGVTRSMERGIITNLGNQVQVWKRMLDILKVAVPLDTETAQAFAWKLAKGSVPTIPAQNCAVLLTVAPHCPRTLLDTIAYIWMQDFGFSHVGFCSAPLAASVPHHLYETACCVDMGWSACHIVASFQGKPFAVRRVPIGARQLIRVWQYHASYRQYNLMDQEWILRDILERASYLSLNFDEEVKDAKNTTAGKRPFDREYLLPDFQTTFEGIIRLPPALQAQKDEEDKENDEEDDDEDVDEAEMEKEAANERSSDEEADEEEETIEQKKHRLLRERAEEERRRLELEASQQVLRLSVERFAIPEVLFRPSDAQLPKEWAGLHEAINQAIQTCPEFLHAPLYRSIQVVGGLSKLSNLKERLTQELRALVPNEYEMSLDIAENGVNAAWVGACELTKKELYTWCFTRVDWEEADRKGAWSTCNNLI